ncbi:hypothetical protein [Candidatus Accumulibacter phosphatis]|uniref:hypothetical protein n=1 Tax=Candidatus Accumulibacter phosphatis TaxID=327160 RepID=UPI0039B9BC5E
MEWSLGTRRNPFGYRHRLSLSPAMVRKQMAHCSQKIGVNNKAELVWRLDRKT